MSVRDSMTVTVMKKHPATLGKILNPACVVCHSQAADAPAAVRELSGLLEADIGSDNAAAAAEIILKRIEEGDVQTLDGVACPHARLGEVDHLSIALATSREGIAFEADGDKRAHVIVMVVAPKSEPALYLEVLGSLARFAMDGERVHELANCESPQEVMQVFAAHDAPISRFVRAGDIMDPVVVTLNEYDTLEKAIDLFTGGQFVNLPVVDNEGELVGVVTAYELLKVCLPDYFMWLDDVSSIINFEPFVEVIRNERKTWLSDIMSEEFAVVSEDAPAIEVAKEILRHKTREAFVIRGRRIVGQISLQRFVQKVFRE